MSAPGAALRVISGIAALARFDRRGFARFEASPDAFLASLAPLVAFPLVGLGLMLVNGGGLPAVVDLLATLCALLAPPVLSHALAGLWRRQTVWLRYAVAFNWCQWAIPAAAALLLALAHGAVLLGAPTRPISYALLAALAAYGLALHGFLVRYGLALSWAPAAAVVVVVNVVTTALVVAPSLLQRLVS